MKKSICTMLIVMMFVSMASSMVLAADIQPYGFACTCGGALNARTTTYDAWVTYEPVKCEKRIGCMILSRKERYIQLISVINVVHK